MGIFSETAKTMLYTEKYGAVSDSEWDARCTQAAGSLLKEIESQGPLTRQSLAEAAQILDSRAECKNKMCPYVVARTSSTVRKCANNCGCICARDYDTCCKSCTSSGGLEHGPACVSRQARAATCVPCAVDGKESKVEACRFSHSCIDSDFTGKLWSTSEEACLCSPASYTELRPLPQHQLAINSQSRLNFLFGESFARLGKERFIAMCANHEAALRHFHSRVGATIVCRGLPQPDELQQFALRMVQSLWGDDIVVHEACQEYLDRSGQIVQSRLTDSQYSAPSRSKISVGGGPKDSFNFARIIKIGIKNADADLMAKRDTAWHGLAAAGLSNWKSSGPKFRADLAKRTAHGGSVYCTPAFEHALAYSVRGAVPPPGSPVPFASMVTKAGEKWNYSAIMQLAIYDRGGAVKEKHQTFTTAPTDGWEKGKIEWVVHDVSKAQIYGLLLCFFPDDKAWGAKTLP
eukprot:gnl/TRDRNA2_/TRDRNA2_63412_c0_seq1.p1 gnl/TRDRNA2_/TRDRNA2_63412_c0~~gnl/TRDRNA2_/TRDRNA2_63412_c0_seq1.p1  ORF type:complete len:462 (-),score=52.71 gnl/TRDRNA2_/TRDRNA2_63412_c0_seq1:319-1704(-)